MESKLATAPTNPTNGAGIRTAAEHVAITTGFAALVTLGAAAVLNNQSAVARFSLLGLGAGAVFCVLRRAIEMWTGYRDFGRTLARHAPAMLCIPAMVGTAYVLKADHVFQWETGFALIFCSIISLLTTALSRAL